ncbi:MAG: transposase [Chloroflexi bacterium]|nr:transposase [Chloroflexota bacterium]
MASLYNRRANTKSASPPVVAELQAIFRELPDEDLLAKLRGPRRRGPRGYDPKILWRCYIAYYALGIESVSSLIRLLQDNPFIARACGIESPDGVPSQPTFSRFQSKLAKPVYATLVKKVLWALTDRLHKELPGFGKSVAIDSTDIKAWSNGGKHHGASDPDAGWCVKTNTEGNKKFVWGYKVHILCDTIYELPIVIDVTRGNVHDSQRATPLLRQARYATNHFWPRHVIADSAYSSDRIREHVSRYYPGAQAIIDPNPTHKRAVAKARLTPEWTLIYNRRTAVERLSGRLKEFHRLNGVRVRGLKKVRLHALLATISLQAKALASGGRACVRKVA